MTEANASNTRRLNPFVFPSETNLRFTLLVVAALMLTSDLADFMGVATGVIKDIPAPSAIDLSTSASVEQNIVEWNQALSQALWAAAVPSVAMLVVLGVAALIYRSHPGRIRRANNLRLMTRGEDAKLVDAVQALASLSGVSPAPSLEVAAGSRSTDGQAFGLPKHYALRLGGRLRLLLRQSPDTFRAIILHELAHIANGDLARTYFAQAIWTAIVFLGVIPVIIFMAFRFIQGMAEKLTGGLTSQEWTQLLTVNGPTFVLALVQVGGTLAIMAAIRGSLLRVREIYADWRAALWGVEAPLFDILRRNTSVDNTGRWARLWRLHPTAQERLAALQDPERLFHVTTELPFFVSVLLAYGLLAVALSLEFGLVVSDASTIGQLQLFRQFYSTANFPILSLTFELNLFATSAAVASAAVLIGGFSLYFVAGALGLEVQREAVADLIAGHRGLSTYLGLWKPAALVAVGFETGILLTPYSFVAYLPKLINSRGLIVLGMVLLVTAILACLSWLWLVYIRFFARRILGSHASALPPHRARRLLTLASSGLLLVLALPAVIGQYVIMAVTLDNTTMQGLLSGFFFTAVAIAPFLYSVIFGATWLLVQAYRWVRRPRCPACRQVTRQRYAAGQVCEHCGRDLAPWLLAN